MGSNPTASSAKLSRALRAALRHARRVAGIGAAFAPLLLAAPATVRAQGAAPSPNWDALGAETAQVLSRYLQVNTTNPPGIEIAAARYLKSVLEREGIEAQILDTAELGPGRANIYARLRGSGRRKAIALVNHMDVVPATPSAWRVPPFSGAIRDSAVWGRGALDMKGEGIVQLMAMVALKRARVPLDRDIVFIGNADEESDGSGAVVFVKRHADLLRDVEFLMTEGGDNLVVDGKIEYFGVGVSEKRTFWQRLTVNGIPSHGSRPTKANPVPRLVAALDHIARFETPLHVTPAVARYFSDIATLYSGQQRAWLADVQRALTDSAGREWILSDVYWNAILRNTITPTVLQGSNKTNVIPPAAVAELDIRLLPDADTAAFRAELLRIVGDTAVHFTTVSNTKAPLESPINTALFHAIERAAHERHPNVPVTTPMLTGATDRPTYRQLGIVTYGFDPFLTPAAVRQEGVHGNNERVTLADLTFGVHYLYDILRYTQ